LVSIASENGLTKTVRLLIMYGASVDYPDQYGNTALFYGEKIQRLPRNTSIFILN
jgi:hypothetical protein